MCVFLETCRDSCEIVWTFFYFLICREPQDGRGSGPCRPEEAAGSEGLAAADASARPSSGAKQDSSSRSRGEREEGSGFRALPLLPLCLPILNNPPLVLPATCSPFVMLGTQCGESNSCRHFTLSWRS